MTNPLKERTAARWRDIIGTADAEDRLAALAQATREVEARILNARKAGATQKEIADHLGLNPYRICQLEARAKANAGKRQPVEIWTDRAVRRLIGA